MTFKIVVPVYKSPWIGKCLTSIRGQTYPDFECIVMEDASGDTTLREAQQAAAGDSRIRVWSNGAHVGALANVIQGIEILHPNPHDVLTIIDGDDWLADSGVLDRVKKEYDSGARLTYGQFRVLSNGKLGHCAEFPLPVRQERTYRAWRGPGSYGQLRTFHAALWRAIRPEDLIDPETGKPWEMAWDVAIMLPMLEMCLPDEIRFIPDVLYIYNDMNPGNDWRKDQQKQIQTDNTIRARAQYPLLPRKA